jgi:hypothetical protein
MTRASARKEQKMNINSYVSPDIAAHCAAIGKSFNALEMAVIIHESNCVLAEKHAGYRQILAEVDDMSLPQSLHHEPIDSVHEQLRALLDLESAMLEAFKRREDNAVYHLVVHDENLRKLDRGMGIFSTWRAALARGQTDWKKEEVSIFSVRKHVIDTGEVSCAEFSYEDELLALWPDQYWDALTVEQRRNMGFLYDFYIDLPSPFVTGDLVEDVRMNEKPKIFVIDALLDKIPETHQRLLKFGDATDMGGTGYQMQTEGGGIVHENIHYHGHLRYFHSELLGEDRVLKYLSQFLKGEIGVEHLINMQNLIMAEEFCRERRFKYTRDVLKYIERRG